MAEQQLVTDVPELTGAMLFQGKGNQLERLQKIQALERQLPSDHAPFTDVYFLRSKQILEAEKINPYVKAQVFIRKGPGAIGGMDEAVAMLHKYTKLFENGGRVYALSDGDRYSSSQTVMVIEGLMQDMVELETIYLGAITRSTTASNDGYRSIDLKKVEERAKEIVVAAEGRPVVYFGARHWGYEQDADIAAAASRAGMIGASTDIGAAQFGKKGQGTIPHFLENAYAHISGSDKAVVESTLAFDRVIDPSVPRVALVDYNNREVDDSVAVARALNGRLSAVRIDTCGENVMQGGAQSADSPEASALRQSGIPLISKHHPHAKFWYGNGVTVTGVLAVRKALDAAGFQDTQIILTSGFGDPEKVKAFVEAEKLLGVKLFDGLGVGGIYSSRTATMDVVQVKGKSGGWEHLCKKGRSYKPNLDLQEVVFN